MKHINLRLPPDPVPNHNDSEMMWMIRDRFGGSLSKACRKKVTTYRHSPDSNLPRRPEAKIYEKGFGTRVSQGPTPSESEI